MESIEWLLRPGIALAVILSLLTFGFALWLTIERCLTSVLHPAESAATPETLEAQLELLATQPERVAPAEAAQWLGNALSQQPSILSDRSSVFAPVLARAATGLGARLRDLLAASAQAVGAKWKTIVVILFAAAYVLGAIEIARLAVNGVPPQLLVSGLWDLILLAGPRQALAFGLAIVTGVMTALVMWSVLYGLASRNNPRFIAWAANLLRPAPVALLLAVAAILPATLLGLGPAVRTTVRPIELKTIVIDDRTLTGRVEAISSQFLVLRQLSCPTSHDPLPLATDQELELLPRAKVQAIITRCRDAAPPSAAASAQHITVGTLPPQPETDEQFARVVLGLREPERYRRLQSGSRQQACSIPRSRVQRAGAEAAAGSVG